MSNGDLIEANPKIFEISKGVFDLAISLINSMKSNVALLDEIVKNAIYPFPEFLYLLPDGVQMGAYQDEDKELFESDFKDWENVYTFEMITADKKNVLCMKYHKTSITLILNAFWLNGKYIVLKDINEPICDKVSNHIGVISVISQIIAEPRLSEISIIDYSALNIKRSKQGKNKLPERRIVRIHKTAEDIVKQTIHMNKNNNEIKRRRHAVRAFCRIKLGKLEIVKSHFRGKGEKIEQTRIVD